MICYFPTAYPDELLYSQLSRYYAKSGYLTYICAAEDLFQQKTVRPNMEFITPLTSAAAELVTRKIPMDAVIQRHTMFPYYGQFLPMERRQKAFQALVSMQRDYYNSLPLPKGKTAADRCLRYCPLCAEQDRSNYGETYWHRIHQMLGMNVCPTHGCYLLNSDIITCSKAPPMLKTAEESISFSGVIEFSENDIECHVAQYMAAVFAADVDLCSDVSVGCFLHSRMGDAGYCSTRGKARNMSIFYAEFMEYYKSLPGNWFSEQWQLQKVMNDDRTNFYEVCLIALFLNIPAGELVNRELPQKTKQEHFDEEINRLHAKGLNYMEIAKQLQASYDTVKSIGEGRYGTYHKPPKKLPHCEKRAKNWEQADTATLPLVQDAIRQLQGDGCSRPVKITIPAIEKMLSLPEQRIKLYLPKCRAEIERHMETQERYWAREVVWAARQILNAGGTLTWTGICRMTNMRRKNVETCLPNIFEYADEHLTRCLCELFSKVFP